MSIKVTKNFNKLKIEIPKDPRFWQAVGIETVSNINKLTESGLDADEQHFKPYAEATIKAKSSRKNAKQGRSPKSSPSLVNLTWTGNMLKAMGRGIRATKSGVKIIVSGIEGGKIWANERRGRQFFAISEKSARQTLAKIKRWIALNN